MAAYTKPLTIAVVLAALLTSCSSIYLPNVPATPMFEKQGEVYLGAHINPKGNASANLALAVGNHVAISGNGSYIDHKGGNQEFRQHLYEGALGYFTAFGTKDPKILEIYAGYGRGESRDADTRATTTGLEPVEIRQMDFDKIFLQANYSRRREQIRIFGKQRELSYGTAIRGSFLRMTDFSIDGAGVRGEENFFIEPVFYTRMQLAKGMHLQYTNGFNIGIVDNEYLKAGNAVFTLGLVFKFGRR